MHKVFWYAPYPDKSIKFYKAKDSKDSGFVLVSTILTLVILFLLAMVVLTLAQQQAKTAVFMRDRNAAFYLAESGIHRAIYEISQIENIAGPLTISSDDSLFQDGSSFTVTINPSESGVYMITSTGTKNGVNRKIKVEGTKTFGNFLFDKEKYFGDDGTNDGTNTYPGVYEVEKHGDVDSFIENNHSITLPEEVPPKTTFDGSSDRTLGPGEYSFSGITLNKDKTLKINGPANVYTDFITLKKSAKIHISGDVNIYIYGDLTLDKFNKITPPESEEEEEVGRTNIFIKGGMQTNAGNDNIIGNPKCPDKFILLFTTEDSGDIILHNTIFYAGIYAPNRAFRPEQGNQIVNGALICKELTKGNIDTTYYSDTQWVVYGGDSGGGEPTDASWSYASWEEL